MPRPRALYLDKWDSGQRNQPSPVRDRLVDLVERRPGISQAEAGRILNRNVSLTVKAAVAGGLLRRQSREDRIDSWLLFPQEEWQPTDPRNPAERPNRQLWVLELMGRAGRLKADAAAGGFVEIGSERFAAAPWVSGSGMPYTTVALTKADIARLRRAHVLLALMAETWNDAPAPAPKPSPKVWPRQWNPPSR